MGDFYVVFAGKTPGIYTNWPSAAAQVVGHGDAIHMRYPTMDAAVEAWNAFHDPAPVANPAPAVEVAVAVFSEGEENPAVVVTERDGIPNGTGGRGRLFSGTNSIGLGEASGSASPAPASAASSSRHTKPRYAADNEELSIQRVLDAVEALKGRVSQLEVDKWELMMQMAHAMQQMAGMSLKGKKK
ncbi:hypothetical protein PIB30_050302 [Stylosanthes scabra]|uniref:Ribonuclease H1 N-terminal domain-containing protein n=1 Tax=Stylosanthes scabra TaxID=79078 RepID=A0ABU6ZGD2_9FABA|nr:hypothetical protein [Stylosanthes scabra]